MARIVEVFFPGLTSQPIQGLEVAAVLLAVLLLRRQPAWLRSLGALWKRVAQRPVLTLVTLGVFLGMAHMMLAWNLPRRAPRLHDEFSYLLSAETFLEGRLTNPTPPEWHALDTVHVNFTPSYNSMYPPGHPLLLAASWRWLGHPIYANWILAPLLGLGAWWLLAGWIPRRWALLGGVLVALRFGLFGYWAESYMTGALPTLCAFAFAGALPRIARRPSTGLIVGAACALAVMFACRPFESVILGLSAIPILWLLRPSVQSLRPVSVLSGAVIFALIVGAVAYHNVALTGQALRFGYDLNMERMGYGVFPGSRAVGTERELTPRQAAFYERTRAYVGSAWTPAALLVRRTRSMTWAWVFLIGPLLSLGILQWRRALLVRRLRPALPGLLGFVVIIVINPFPYPHYYSGTFGFLLIVAVTGIRLWCVRNRVAAGIASGTLVAVSVVVLAVRVIAGEVTAPPQHSPIPWLPYNMPTAFDSRQAFEQEIVKAGPALVFVRHDAEETSPEDWVYNKPDPARSEIVWANDRGPDGNSRTERAYPGRRLFCIEVVSGQPRRLDCTAWIRVADPGDGADSVRR